MVSHSQAAHRRLHHFRGTALRRVCLVGISPFEVNSRSRCCGTQASGIYRESEFSGYWFCLMCRGLATHFPRSYFSRVSALLRGCYRRVFWSADGSVIVARDSAATDSSGLKATYDYIRHEMIRYDTTRMQALITSRGGLGPEHQDYSDGKDWDYR